MLFYLLDHNRRPFNGTVKASPCKHHAAVFLGAAATSNEPSTFDRLPFIHDTDTLINTLELTGYRRILSEQISSILPPNTSGLELTIPAKLATRSRNIFLLLPGITEQNTVKLGVPTGCQIGKRPFQWYLDVLNEFGWKTVQHKSRLEIGPATPRPAKIFFKRPSYSGTVIAILCASIAKGASTINNISIEPSVLSLIEMLKRGGVNIEWTGQRDIKIHATSRPCWDDVIKVPSDREEIVTLACATLITRGRAKIIGKSTGLEPFLELTNRIGANVSFADNTLEIAGYRSDSLLPFDISFGPHPAIHTDWGPILSTLALTVSGTSHLCDSIFDKRFIFCDELVKIGAKISTGPSNSAELKKNYSKISVEGGGDLLSGGGPFQISDLRGSVAVLLAGLHSKRPVLVHAQQIRRGHEDLLSQLRELGAYRAKCVSQST